MQIVHEDYLFEIDESGYFAGQCYEGALGVVLKIGLRNSGWRALKLPRVLADSDRENYFIAALMADELKNAGKVGAPPELLALESNKSLLQRMATTGTLEKPLRQMLLAQLPKARRPRFCAIVFDHEANVVELRPDLPELQWLKASGGEWRKSWAPPPSKRMSPHTASSSVVRVKAARSAVEKRASRMGAPPPGVHSRQVGHRARHDRRGSWDCPHRCTTGAEGRWNKPFASAQGARGRSRSICISSNGLRTGWTRSTSSSWSTAISGPRTSCFTPRTQNRGPITGSSTMRPLARRRRSIVESPPRGKRDQRDRTVLGGGVAEARQSPFYAPERRIRRESEDCDTVMTLYTSQDVAKLLTKREGGKARGPEWLVHAGFQGRVVADIAGPEPGRGMDGRAARPDRRRTQRRPTADDVVTGLASR